MKLKQQLVDQFDSGEIQVEITPKEPKHVKALRMLLPGAGGISKYYKKNPSGYNSGSNPLPGLPIVHIEDFIEAERSTVEELRAMTYVQRIDTLKKMYPHGCVYKSAGDGREHTCDHNAKDFGFFILPEFYIEGGISCGYLFYEGNWAEIVSYPTEQSEQPATKTVREWFEAVENPKLRAWLLENMRRPDDIAESEWGALRGGFSWRKTEFKDACKLSYEAQSWQPLIEAIEWDQVSTEPIPVTIRNFRIGMKVVRGKDWDYRDQDGGEGNIGEITYDSDGDGLCSVRWSNGHENNYRIGRDGKYDLYIAPGEPEYGGQSVNYVSNSASPQMQGTVTTIGEPAPDIRKVIGWRLNIDVPEWVLPSGAESVRINKHFNSLTGMVGYEFHNGVSEDIFIPETILRIIATPIYEKPVEFTTEAGQTVTLTEKDIENILKLKK